MLELDLQLCSEPGSPGAVWATQPANSIVSLPYISVQMKPVDLGTKGSVEQPNLDLNHQKPQPQTLTARVTGGIR